MTSATENIETILRIVNQLKPKKILDIGTGFGKFSLLIREMTLSGIAENKKIMLPKDKLTIDCAEEAKYFQNLKYHNNLYDNHWHKDVMKMPIKKLNSYDLILLIDIVEHWNKKITKEWLKKIKTNVLISTPKNVIMFKENYYNARNHVSQWYRDDFRGVESSTEKSYIFMLN